MKHEKNRSKTGNMDEGLNETTRLPYTDSVSTQASDETKKKHKKKK